jgi:hypothetical protein
MLPTKLGGRQASLLFLDHPDNLRLGETASPHLVCSFRVGRLYITARALSGGRSLAVGYDGIPVLLIRARGVLDRQSDQRHDRQVDFLPAA